VYDVNNKQEKNSRENLYRKHYYGRGGFLAKKFLGIFSAKLLIDE